MKTQPAIECIGLRRTFTSRNLVGRKQETVALDNLSISVDAGQVFGLLGPNGAGKTTTIRILCTLLTPTAGRAFVQGFDVARDAANVRKRIGLILGGERGLYGRLTGIENMNYFAAMNRLGRKLTKERVKELIEMVGLTSAGNRLVEQYSRGMRQRLHIARGLLTDPEILFMDEPTIGLDPEGAQELRQLIPDLVHQGKTILLTTHYMYEADELCHQVAIINKGTIVVSGTPSDIKRKFSKIKIFEVLVRQNQSNVSEKLVGLSGVERIIKSSDGALQKLTIHATPGADISSKISEILGQASLESCIERDPTLEEAYLSIIK